MSTDGLLTKTTCRPTLGRHIGRVSVDITAECRSPYRPIVSTDTRSTDALSTHDPRKRQHFWVCNTCFDRNFCHPQLIEATSYLALDWYLAYDDLWKTYDLWIHQMCMYLQSFPAHFRYYRIGVLVLFLHDINDVILEFTKLSVAFKSRGGEYHLIPDITSTVGFLTFASLW